MNGLSVEPEELIRNGNTLRAIAVDLDLAHGRIEELRSKALGSRQIDGALNHFADHWKYGMTRLVEVVDTTGQALIGAGTAYQEADLAVRAAFGMPLTR